MTFEHDTMDGRTYTVEFTPVVQSEVDVYAENITVFDSSINEFISPDNISKDEWRKIEQEADRICGENAYDLYQDEMMGKADDLYEMWRDDEF